MLNIAIPVYNEGPEILKIIEELDKHVRTDYKAYFIYDFEADPTLPYLKEEGVRDNRIVPVRNRFGRGSSNAIKTGLLLKTGDNPCLVTMADLSDELNKIDQMYTLIGQGYDVVCASRYMRGGGQINVPWIKGFLSRLAGLSLYYLAGIPTHDATNNFKIYSRRFLDKMNIESNNGPELALEMTVKAYFSGYKIKEIPTVWRERTSGKSNFKLIRWLPGYLKWYCWAIKESFLLKIKRLGGLSKCVRN